VNRTRVGAYGTTIRLRLDDFEWMGRPRSVHINSYKKKIQGLAWVSSLLLYASFILGP